MDRVCEKYESGICSGDGVFRIALEEIHGLNEMCVLSQGLEQENPLQNALDRRSVLDRSRHLDVLPFVEAQQMKGVVEPTPLFQDVEDKVLDHVAEIGIDTLGDVHHDDEFTSFRG